MWFDQRLHAGAGSEDFCKKATTSSPGRSTWLGAPDVNANRSGMAIWDSNNFPHGRRGLGTTPHHRKAVVGRSGRVGAQTKIRNRPSSKARPENIGRYGTPKPLRTESEITRRPHQSLSTCRKVSCRGELRTDSPGLDSLRRLAIPQSARASAKAHG